jgi:predicted transglutaminase-like cysteine proteinase
MYRVIAIIALLAGPARAELVELDPGRWQLLSEVSRGGFELGEISDRSRYRRADYWEAADGAGGDCEDKALRARAALLKAGWPAPSLRLAMVWTEAGEYHAVLTIDVVRNGQAATYVIDNRFAWVLGWDALSRYGYRWDRRQASRGPGWVGIASPRSLP